MILFTYMGFPLIKYISPSISQNLSNPLPTFVAYLYSPLQKTLKGFEVGSLILNSYGDILIVKTIWSYFLKKSEINIFFYLRSHLL